MDGDQWDDGTETVCERCGERRVCAEVDRLRAELAAAPTWATTPPTADGVCRPQ